jgi:hypothetical protein
LRCGSGPRAARAWSASCGSRARVTAPFIACLPGCSTRSDYHSRTIGRTGTGMGAAELNADATASRRFSRRPNAAGLAIAFKQKGPKQSALRSPRMVLRPAFEQASVVLFVARLALLIAAGCVLPALPAAAEDDAPPNAICSNPELSLSGVISVPDGPPAGAEYVVCMPAPEDWIGDLSDLRPRHCRSAGGPGQD